ncbi:Uncharacterized protein RNJ44_03195 [Nakaseomyces bracarensis]|uniref:Uncharacterized protein n=1 Tax=Nakaseomyces bracarensis TaxID=273131 RepID=A0ABR4NZ29_9SACH
MNELDLEFIPSLLREDLIRTIIQSLQEPSIRTAVSRQYDNTTLTEDDTAVARLYGKSWTYRIKGQSVTIGRNTDTFDSSLNWTTRAGLDIDLGPSKTVSRTHAKITFDEMKKKWVFTALGRNGAKINGRKIKPTESEQSISVTIENGTLLEVGGIDMLFVVSGKQPEYTQKSLEGIASRLYKYFNLNEKSINVIENPFVWGIVKNSKYYNSKVRSNLIIPEGSVPVQQLKLQIELEKMKPLRAKKLLHKNSNERNKSATTVQEDANQIEETKSLDSNEFSKAENEKKSVNANIEPTEETKLVNNSAESEEVNGVNVSNSSVSENSKDVEQMDKNDNEENTEIPTVVDKPLTAKISEVETIPKWNFYSKSKDTNSISDSNKDISKLQPVDKLLNSIISPISEEPSVPTSKRINETSTDVQDKRQKLSPSIIYNNVEKTSETKKSPVPRLNPSTTPTPSKENSPKPNTKPQKPKTYSKPKDSYATLITKAILSNPNGEMSLSEILKYISSEYPYFENSTLDWPNSVRHNLSVNKKFEKVSKKSTEIGKGNNWRISAAYQEEFLQKWRRGTLKFLKRTDAVDRQLLLFVSKHGDLPKRTDTDNSPKRILVQSMSEAPGPSR